MKRIHSFFISLLALGLIVGCNPSDDNDSNNSNSDFTENFGNQVSRDFIGQVVDESGDPVQGADVKIGAKTVQTDVNGVFIINGANVYTRFAYITAKKTGFIDGSRAMVPTNGKNNVKIMLISNAPVQTIQSGVASEVTLPNGTKVNFDGAFQNENGTAYSGSVQVAMYHLEASNENLSSLMPGMLYAQDTNGNEKVLETFGMMNVELKGTSGQKLQIASGHTAKITMAIDNTQLATAPSSIPLWHFDEVKGYWKEEGSAQKVGNTYVGTVSHFSWWNCDYPYPAVNLTVTVLNSNGDVLSNVTVQIVNNSNNYGPVGFTDNTGTVSGIVPANQSLTLNVYDSCGGGIIYTSQIGPFSVATTLPTITINNSILSSQIIGNLLKCDATNVTNGYVMLTRNGNSPTFTPVTNGNFSFNAIYCNSDTNFRLKGVDYDNLQATDSISYNFTAPITNIGNLTACNTVTEFISYQIDGGVTTLCLENLSAYIASNGAGTPLRLVISGSDQQQNSILIYQTGWSGLDLGTYTTNEYSIEGTLGYIHSGSTNTISFNLNNLGNVGEYVDMTFSGSYTDSTGTHTLNGIAHVIRDN